MKALHNEAWLITKWKKEIICLFLWLFGFFFPTCVYLTLLSVEELISLVFSDGAAMWADKPGQHLLYERHSAVLALCARAQNCPQKVCFSAVLGLCNIFRSLRWCVSLHCRHILFE